MISGGRQLQFECGMKIRAVSEPAESPCCLVGRRLGPASEVVRRHGSALFELGELLLNVIGELSEQMSLVRVKNVVPYRGESLCESKCRVQHAQASTVRVGCPTVPWVAPLTGREHMPVVLWRFHK